LLSTTAFSAVASHSVNDCFSTTYDDYKVLITLSGLTADNSFFMKLRVSGTDSSTGYNFMVPSYNTSAVSSFGNAANNSGGIFIFRTDSGNNNASYAADLTVYKPFLATETTFTGVGVGRNGAGLTEGASIIGCHTVTTSYTSLTIYNTTGNISGSVSVYGYNK
jgi:hypothetical protein